MKVLHINGNYIWTTLHQQMIRSLSNAGIENCVFVPTHDKKNAVIDLDDNVVADDCFNKSDRFLFFHKQKKIIAAVERLFDIESFDIIHAYTLFTDGNAAMQLSKRYGIPYVVAVRNTDVNTFFKYRFFLRNRGLKILENASNVFFLSETYKEKTIDSYVPKKLKQIINRKSYVIPNGIDHFWLENIYRDRDCEEIEERISEKRIRLVFAGIIDKNKNIELTARAAEQLINKGWDVHFTVVGKVADKKVAGRLRQKSFVSMIDKMPKESLIKQYREADIFVMPSHYESFGLVYAEAMSQGLPVIYTRGQGFDKNFEDGVIGYSVNDREIDDVVNHILRIAEDYSSISRRCIEKVFIFDWNLIAQQYLTVYNKVV